jgi:hypothetical protein
MALNHSMLATQMRINRDEAMKKATPITSGYAATAQQAALTVPVLIRTKSGPLQTALEILEENRKQQAEAEKTQTKETQTTQKEITTLDTETDEEEEDKAKDKKEDQERALTPNQEPQGRTQPMEIAECETPRSMVTEQIERRVTRSQTRNKPKTE